MGPRLNPILHVESELRIVSAIVGEVRRQQELLEEPCRVRAVPLAPEQDKHYVIALRRSGTSSSAVWPVRLQDALPVVPVPLLSPDADVPLNLNKAIQAIYDNASYDLRIDYTQPPPKPPLLPDDQQWLETHLQAAGLRAHA